MDIAVSKRGQGTFVTEDTEIISKIREDMKTEILMHFIQQMYEMGYEKEEIKRGVKDYLDREEE